MENQDIQKILIANRGVPAIRIMNTCRDMQIDTVAVYSKPDRLAHHVMMADSAKYIGEAPPGESYLNIDNIVEAALQSGADAVHPGWGFLSENADFAQRVEEAGLIWIGPKHEVIRLMGDKITSKKVAQKAGVPTVPGLSQADTPEQVQKWMADEDVAYPILIKASAGGGGKGMVKVFSDKELPGAMDQARSEALKSFGNDTILVEKYIEHSKHIEVQVVADQFGNAIHLFERECTIQRRNQKVVEESPSPSLTEGLREEICQKGVDLMKDINYTSAGTVEFILDMDTQKFYFLEVNTRLQVEHGITELVTGLDIVSLMIEMASGKPLELRQTDIVRNRWAMEVRVNAEDPKNFSPSFGCLTTLKIPRGPAVRILEGAEEGSEIPPYYDSLIMLLMASGRNRKDAISVMDRALRSHLKVKGVKTLQPLLINIIHHPDFRVGNFSTNFIEKNYNDLTQNIPDKEDEDEVMRIARYVAERSALGIPEWI